MVAKMNTELESYLEEQEEKLERLKATLSSRMGSSVPEDESGYSPLSKYNYRMAEFDDNYMENRMSKDAAQCVPRKDSAPAVGGGYLRRRSYVIGVILLVLFLSLSAIGLVVFARRKTNKQ